MTLTADTDTGVDVAQDIPRHRAFDALEQLIVADVEALDRAGLDTVVAARRCLASVLDSVDVRIARRSRLLAEAGQSEPATDVLRDRGRRSNREAAAVANRERTCEQLPSFEDALADGAVSAGHVDALANATARLDDEGRSQFAQFESALLADAQRSSVESFERSCRDLARSLTRDDGASELERQRARNNVKHWVDRVSGMHHIHAELDPESGAKVWTALNQRLSTLRKQAGDRSTASPEAEPTQSDASDPDYTRSYPWLEAQAFIDITTGSSTLDRRLPEVVVLVDLATLLEGLRDSSVSETAGGVALPPSTIRRLCCEADILPAVLGGDGEILDVGRSRRLATAAQRRALEAMYTTCAFPGCSTTIECCEIHHVTDWLHHGRTDLGNLAPLCCRHHHLVHEGGWSLAIGSRRTVTVHRPDGTHYFRGTTTNRRRT